MGIEYLNVLFELSANFSTAFPARKGPISIIYFHLNDKFMKAKGCHLWTIMDYELHGILSETSFRNYELEQRR